MIRASNGNAEYWNARVQKFQQVVQADLLTLHVPSPNPLYAPQYWLDHCQYQFRITMLRYSRGDRISELTKKFSDLLDAWEMSNRLSGEASAKSSLITCRDWTFELADLNHYNWCFWLVGLALTLEVPDEEWQRLVVLIGGEGEDRLLDLVMATRQPGRKIGAELLHPKPYRRLLKAIDATGVRRPELLRDFVDHWYPELARKGKDELWWYIYGDPVKHPLEKGSYFGRWCIEAAVVAKAFAIDDALCLGHEYYPGDLLRPDGPSTHPDRTSRCPVQTSKVPIPARESALFFACGVPDQISLPFLARNTTAI